MLSIRVLPIILPNKACNTFISLSSLIIIVSGVGSPSEIHQLAIAYNNGYSQAPRVELSTHFSSMIVVKERIVHA